MVVGSNVATTDDWLLPLTVPLSTPLMTIGVPLGTGSTPSISFDWKVK